MGNSRYIVCNENGCEDFRGSKLRDFNILPQNYFNILIFFYSII